MPRVTEEHRAARREQIMDAAIRCVVREGFHKTTMAHVIAESGLSAGAVYGYFKGKPDLIRAIADRAIGSATENLMDAAVGPEPVDVVAVFAGLVNHVARLHAEFGIGVVALHAWSEAARDEGVREVVSGKLATVHAHWVRILERAQSEGSISGEGDPEAMARALVGMMPGFLVQGPLLGVVDAETYVRGLSGLLGIQGEARC